MIIQHDTLEYNTLIILPVNILGGIDKKIVAMTLGPVVYIHEWFSPDYSNEHISDWLHKNVFNAVFAKNHKNSKKSILNASSCYIGFWLVFFLLPLMFKNKS